MNKFIDLVSFEMNRFLKFLLPTFVVVATIQLFQLFRQVISYNNNLERAIASGTPMDTYSSFSAMNVTNTSLFEFSLYGIILVFMFYSFFIWYREWLGKNTFIYRLLMLPVNRMTIFMSKTLVFLIGGLLAFVFQFGMYALILFLSELLIPAEYYMALSVHNIQSMFTQSLLFPTTLFQFISRYSFAFGALVSLYTAIILERTYRIKGLIIGVVYFIGYFVLFALFSSLPFIRSFPIALRPSHGAILTLIYQLFMILLGHLISWPLLKNRIKI